MNLRQKLIPLSLGTVLAGLAYVYGIAAPARRVQELRGALEGANSEIAAARAAIEEVREVERSSSAIRMHLAQRDRAATSPLFWFPEQMSNYFAAVRLRNVSARVNTALPEPGLPQYQRTYWAVTLPLDPNTDQFEQALLAVSELEAGDPLLRVHSVAASVENRPGALAGPNITATISLLTRKF